MPKPKTPLPPWASACAIWLALACGCATQTQTSPDVGKVVVAPQVQLPPPPQIVQQTAPMPVGYFQCRLLSYFGQPCERPTTSTLPMQVVGPTPTQ